MVVLAKRVVIINIEKDSIEKEITPLAEGCLQKALLFKEDTEIV